MTPRPTDVGTYGEMLYERLAPLAYADEENGWALLILCGAIGRMYQGLHDLVSDSDAGPGWSSLLDVDRCQVEHLPFLAQLVGVALPPGLPEASARARIRTPAGFVRGTVAALKDAAQRTLTGNKTVQVLERTSSAYTLTVVTLTSETPDPAATNRDLQAAKPVGLILTHVVTNVTIVDALAGSVDALAGNVDAL